MAIEREIRHLKRGEHYAGDFSTVIQQRDPDSTTLLQIRRVRQTGAKEDELQIEITVTKHHAKRDVSAHSSFVVPAKFADMIGNACLHYHPDDEHAILGQRRLSDRPRAPKMA